MLLDKSGLRKKHKGGISGAVLSQDRKTSDKKLADMWSRAVSAVMSDKKKVEIARKDMERKKNASTGK